MSSHADPRKLPVPWRKGAGPGVDPDLTHHAREWWSGERAPARLPADFEWTTSPKQYQEENGAGNVAAPLSK